MIPDTYLFFRCFILIENYQELRSKLQKPGPGSCFIMKHLQEKGQANIHQVKIISFSNSGFGNNDTSLGFGTVERFMPWRGTVSPEAVVSETR